MFALARKVVAAGLAAALTTYAGGAAAQATTRAPTPRPGSKIPATIMSEPAFRAYQLWNPALLRSAEILADGGNLRLAADLCETMLADDRVKAVLDTRTDALLALKLTFEKGLAGQKTAAAHAMEAGEDWWASFPETEIKLLHAWGLILGVGLARIDWVSGPDGKRVIPKITIHNPRHLRWDWVNRRWLLQIIEGDPATAAPKEIEIQPGDGRWIIYTPYGSARPWVYGAYRALSRWCLLKTLAISDWGCFSERQGQGTWVVTGADGSDEQRKQIGGDLQALGRNAALALPAGFSLQLVESVSRNWETFKAQIAVADEGIAITILGQNLTTQVDGGSKAATSEHGKVALGRTRADAETLSTCVHDQALTWWATFNFGSPAAAPWPVWDTRPIEDLKELAATLQMLAQAVASFKTAGVPIDFSALCARFDVPILKTPPAAVSPEPGEPAPAKTPPPLPSGEPDGDEKGVEPDGDEVGKGAEPDDDDEMPAAA